MGLIHVHRASAVPNVPNVASRDVKVPIGSKSSKCLEHLEHVSTMICAKITNTDLVPKNATLLEMGD